MNYRLIIFLIIVMLLLASCSYQNEVTTSHTTPTENTIFVITDSPSPTPLITSSPSPVITYGTVKLSNDSSHLNLRNIPSTEGDILAKLSNGTEVIILAIENNWYKINTGSYIGYVYGEYIIVSNSSKSSIYTAAIESDLITPTPLVSKEAIITYSSANLLYNNHVGNEWEYGVEIDGTNLRYGSSITLQLTQKKTEILCYAIEYDKINDYGSDYSTINLQQLSPGTHTYTYTVIVIENRGRYSGNTAKWSFIITIQIK